MRAAKEEQSKEEITQEQIPEALQHQRWEDGEEPAEGPKTLQQII